MTRTLGRLAIITLFAIVASAPGASAFERVVQDDRALVLWPDRADALLDLARSWGVAGVRMTVYPNRRLTSYEAAADRARARGMSIQVTLAQPMGHDELDRESFTSWAAGAAARLGRHGVTRFSVLNEPDLLLDAPDDCDPATATRMLTRLGIRPTVQRVRIRVPVTRLVSGRTRKGRIIRVRRPVYRIVRRVIRDRHGRRRVVRHRVRRTKLVDRAQETLELTSDSLPRVEITVARGCLMLQRARRAAAFYRSAVPALREAVPGARILIGETSPVPGVELFLQQLAGQDLPAVDGFAHHPYANPWGPSVTSGLYLDKSDLLRDLVHRALGPVPISFTEFGAWARRDPVAVPLATGADLWREATRQACALGVDQLVAYQLAPTPDVDGVPVTWDTGLLGPGERSTPASGVFSSWTGCEPSVDD